MGFDYSQWRTHPMPVQYPPSGTGGGIAQRTMLDINGQPVLQQLPVHGPNQGPIRCPLYDPTGMMAPMPFRGNGTGPNPR
jgi:hypothetical protein